MRVPTGKETAEEQTDKLLLSDLPWMLPKVRNTDDTGSNPNSATAGILLSVISAH